MYNWNDIEVEQKIAQERYQSIIEGRRIARARRRATDGSPVASAGGRLSGWLGDLLIRWGCALRAFGNFSTRTYVLGERTAGVERAKHTT